MAVYLPGVGNDFVDWDDVNMVVRNPRFNPPTWGSVGWYWTHVAWNLYQPMTTTFWAGCARAGWVGTPSRFGGHMNPAVFHLAQYALHAAAAAAGFWVLSTVVRRPWAAAAGAAVFAVHPVQVEAVAFIGAVNNPLFAFWGLLALAIYLRPRPSVWTVGLSTLCLLAAELAKPTAVVLVPMAWVLDGIVHRTPWRSRIARVAPWALAAIPCVVWTVASQHGRDAARSPVWTRPVIAADAVAFHLTKVVRPWPLAIDYGRTPARVLGDPTSHRVAAAILVVVVLVAAWAGRRRYPRASAGVGLFLLGLLPNSGLVPFDFQSYSTTADRYAYLPMLGIGLSLAAGLDRLQRRAAAGVAAALLIPCGVFTERQLTYWRDSVALYGHALQVNPRSWVAMTNLADVIGDDDPEAAVDLCRRSIAVRPDSPATWNTLGSVLMRTGDRSSAIAAFETACRLAPGESLYAANAARARAGR